MEEYELVKSPLCQTLTVDGQMVDVEIYRGQDSGWILEVVDQFNGSTIWDDRFETDLAAFEELLRTIREEGIQSLVGPPN